MTSSTYSDRIDGVQTSIAIKAQVKAATTANISLSGEQTIDNVAVVADDRVLVWNQTDTTENGIYDVSATSWTRSKDFNGVRDAAQGSLVWVIGGTAWGEKFFQLTTTDDPIVFGTSNITFAEATALVVDRAKWKQTVKASSTANIASLSGEQTVDGIALVSSDRVLVKNQTSPENNGIYVVSASAWARASDFDAWTDVPGAVVTVEEGTSNADTVWLCTSNQGGTLGTTAVTWAEVGGGISSLVEDTTPQLGGPLDPNGNQIGWDKGGDIASASPLVIDTDGNYFDVTGTTGFSAMTVDANKLFVLQFDGVLTMTHGASLNLPGGVNITTAAGDEAICFSTAANTVRVIAYTKADGTPVVAAGGGKVLQVLHTAKTDTFTTTSASLVGITGLSQAITLSNSANKVLVLYDLNLGRNSTGNHAYVSLARGGSVIIEGDTAGSRFTCTKPYSETSADQSGTHYNLSGSYLDSPGSVGPHTYQMQLATRSSGAAHVNRSDTDTDSADYGRGVSTITLLEIDGT